MNSIYLKSCKVGTMIPRGHRETQGRMRGSAMVKWLPGLSFLLLFLPSEREGSSGMGREQRPMCLGGWLQPWGWPAGHGRPRHWQAGFPLSGTEKAGAKRRRCAGGGIEGPALSCRNCPCCQGCVEADWTPLLPLALLCVQTW